MFLFPRCLHLLVKIFIKVTNGLMINPEVEKRSICDWPLYCVINFCLFANGSVTISIKFFTTDFVFFPVHPAVLKNLAKIDLAMSNSKCASFFEANHSTTFTRVLRPWRSIIKSKSVQFVADNSTAESYFLSVSVSVEANELKTCQSLVEASYANEDIQQNKNI